MTTTAISSKASVSTSRPVISQSTHIKRSWSLIQSRNEEASQVNKTSIGRALGKGLDLLDMLQIEPPLLCTKDLVVADFPFKLRNVGLPAPSNTLVNL